MRDAAVLAAQEVVTSLWFNDTNAVQLSSSLVSQLAAVAQLTS